MAKSEAYEFAMSFIAASDKYREDYFDKWREVISNFIVDPDYSYEGDSGPYGSERIYKSNRKNIILKDPETHKLVMTYASKLALSCFGDQKGEYIRTRPVGYEDATKKSPTVTKLLRYALRLRGHYRTFVESLIDMIQFGTSVVEIGYKYEEREMLVRTVQDYNGIETQTIDRVRVPSYDDVVIRPIDIMDFYPDPSRYRMQDMTGAAKRFKMNGMEAMRLVETGIFSRSGVEDAMNYSGDEEAFNQTENIRKGLDQPWNTSVPSDFKEMIGYEYYGDVPFKTKDGSSRRVLTVLNDSIVRDEPYQFMDDMLPFHTLIINPIQGRFYGLAPAEVVRYDQSFADAIKILLAEAIIRQVHPPIAFDPDSDPDVAAVRAWKPDSMIAVRGGPNAIGTVRYDANISNGFAMLAGLKQQIQESSGATGSLQGEPGPSREAASVGVQRIQMAMDRPELAASIIEKDCLPPIGKAILRRYQQFLEGTDALRKRVGELPEPVWIGDIMGDFDIEFVGSRMATSNAQRLQSIDRMVALASAVSPLMAMIPWQEVGQWLFGEVLDLPEIAAKMADPNTMVQNALLTQVMAPQAGGPARNGVGAAPEPTNIMPAEAMGGVQ